MRCRRGQVMAKARDWRFACAAGLCAAVLVVVILLGFKILR